MWEKFASALVANGSAKEEDKELYAYGLREGAVLVLNIITSLVIGLLMGMVWQTAVFIIIYSPLRSFAGGAHAKTHFRCYLLSILLILVSLVVIKITPQIITVIVLISLLSGLVVYLLVPVEDKNKPLDKLEIKVYRKKARLILMIEMIILAAAILASFIQMAMVIAVALGALALMLIIGKIKNTIIEKAQ